MNFELLPMPHIVGCLECRGEVTHVLVSDNGQRWGYFCEECGVEYGKQLAKDEGGTFSKQELK